MGERREKFEGTRQAIVTPGNHISQRPPAGWKNYLSVKQDLGGCKRRRSDAGGNPGRAVAITFGAIAALKRELIVERVGGGRRRGGSATGRAGAYTKNWREPGGSPREGLPCDHRGNSGMRRGLSPGSGFRKNASAARKNQAARIGGLTGCWKTPGSEPRFNAPPAPPG